MQAGGEIAAHFTCVSEWPAHSRLIASTAFRSSLKGLEAYEATLKIYGTSET